MWWVVAIERLLQPGKAAAERYMDVLVRVREIAIIHHMVHEYIKCAGIGSATAIPLVVV